MNINMRMRFIFNIVTDLNFNLVCYKYNSSRWKWPPLVSFAIYIQRRHSTLTAGTSPLVGACFKKNGRNAIEYGPHACWGSGSAVPGRVPRSKGPQCLACRDATSLLTQSRRTHKGGEGGNGGGGSLVFGRTHIQTLSSNLYILFFWYNISCSHHSGQSNGQRVVCVRALVCLPCSAPSLAHCTDPALFPLFWSAWLSSNGGARMGWPM